MTKMKFIEHPIFTKQIGQLVSDDEYSAFQQSLAENPDTGSVIPGMGGLRKIRLALPGQGKRGGARVLYLLFIRADTIFFLYAFTKGDMKDLPPDKKRIIRTLVDEIKQEFEL